MAHLHSPLPPPRSSWEGLLRRALAEDLGSGDVTSSAVLPEEAQARGEIEARAPLVRCGLFLAEAAFRSLDPAVRFQACGAEGTPARPGEVLAVVEGAARPLLAAERTALNFLGRLCGVASWTRRFVDAVAGTGVRILDTRKTLPGWRVLEKYAVAVGGGTNHRFGLYDAVLVKDNHVAAVGGVAAAVAAARAAAPPHLQIQVEVESLAQAEEALAAGADLLLLDNRSPEELARLVAALGDRIPLEASGGISLDNVRQVAESGVGRISVGALTHSAPWADLALELRPGAHQR